MTTALDICVCTFRRESLRETLVSLLALEIPPGITAGILVIDNDDTPSAQALVAAVGTNTALPIRYLHRPGRNISLARNAALEASDAPLVAFIDDDETAHPRWIAELLEMRASSRAEIVLGPVAALYPATAPRWMRQAELHATQPVWVEGEIQTGYSCNVLIDRGNPSVARARFDRSFGRTGGEDSFYFRALTASGAKIAFAPEAWVFEPVTPERLRLSWLLRRRFRMGKTHAQSLLTHDHVARWPAMGLATVKALICAGMAAICLPNRARSVRDAMRACLHLGVVLGLAGHGAAEIYGGRSSGDAT